jgi:hypothetical protein
VHLLGRLKYHFLATGWDNEAFAWTHAKIVVVTDWEEPCTMNDVRVFLGLANYYRRFVEGYSKIVAPLTYFLKKERTWNWMEKRKTTFTELKHIIVSSLVLKLSDFEQSFEV